MNKLKLTSPIPPSVNHYLGWRTIKKQNKFIAVSYETKEAKQYKKLLIPYIQEQTSLQKWNKSISKTQHYYLDAVFYFPRIDMDANNYFKCLADAITDSKAVWIDDTQLCERVQGVFYDSENPRIELTIYPVDYVGIFKDAEQLEHFENTCSGCARYNRNCKLLTNAKNGRVQKEISNVTCLSFKEKKEDKQNEL